MTNDFFSPIAMLIAFAFMMWLLIFLPANMAKKRGRSAIGWVLMFWIFSPVLGIIALLVLGDSKRKIREDIMDEFNMNK